MIQADLSGMQNAPIQKQGIEGPYNRIVFSIVIQLGGTELCAHIEWVENVSNVEAASLILVDIDYFNEGITRSGPVSIVPEPIDLPPGGRNMN